MSDITINDPPRHGIAMRYSTTTEIQLITITESSAHCIRLEHCYNTSLDHANFTRCGDNGMEIINVRDTHLNHAHFQHMVSKAINLLEGSINTFISNSFIEFSPLFGLQLDSVFNTTLENISVSECGMLCSNITNTFFSNVNIISNTLAITISSANSKVVASVFTVSDTLIFANNTAPLGAAIIMQQRSVMTLLDNASILFIGNHSTSVGGAIYVDTNTYYSTTGSGTVTLSSQCIFQTHASASTIHFQFQNNSAEDGGDVLWWSLGASKN